MSIGSGILEFLYPNFAILHKHSWSLMQRCKHYRHVLPRDSADAAAVVALSLLFQLQSSDSSLCHIQSKTKLGLLRTDSSPLLYLAVYSEYQSQACIVNDKPIAQGDSDRSATRRLFPASRTSLCPLRPSEFMRLTRRLSVTPTQASAQIRF